LIAIKILTEDIQASSPLYQYSKGITKKPHLKALIPYMINK